MQGGGCCFHTGGRLCYSYTISTFTLLVSNITVHHLQALFTQLNLKAGMLSLLGLPGARS